MPILPQCLCARQHSLTLVPPKLHEPSQNYLFTVYTIVVVVVICFSFRSPGNNNNSRPFFLLTRWFCSVLSPPLVPSSLAVSRIEPRVPRILDFYFYDTFWCTLFSEPHGTCKISIVLPFPLQWCIAFGLDSIANDLGSKEHFVDSHPRLCHILCDI